MDAAFRTPYAIVRFALWHESIERLNSKLGLETGRTLKRNFRRKSLILLGVNLSQIGQNDTSWARQFDPAHKFPIIANQFGASRRQRPPSSRPLSGSDNPGKGPSLGKRRLIHVSELAEGRTENVEDIVKKGDIITAKWMGVDEKGRVKMSRRAVLRDEKAKAAESEGDQG